MNVTIVFALVSGLNFGIIFLNIPPALTTLMNLYGLSYTGASVLMSALLWTHALMQIPAGMLVDRLNLKLSLVLGFGLMACGNLVPAMIPSFSLAITGRILTGIGSGLSFVSIMKLIALSSSTRMSGTYQAFFAACFSLGSILAYLAIPELLSLGWQWAYLLPGFSSGLLLVIWSFIKLGEQPSSVVTPLPLGQLLRIRTGWILGSYHALSYGSMMTLGNWVPSLLAEVWSQSTANQLVWGGALTMLFGGLGRLVGGFMVLRFSALGIVNGSMVVIAILFGGLYFVQIPMVTLVLALIAVWFASLNFGALFELVSRTVNSASLASAFGFVNFLANLGAVIFTLIFGLAKDYTGSFFGGFLIMALAASVAYFNGRNVLRQNCAAQTCT
jgi:MFS transporter, NNP family, nitrate/nitrite transporter